MKSLSILFWLELYQAKYCQINYLFSTFVKKHLELEGKFIHCTLTFVPFPIQCSRRQHQVKFDKILSKTACSKWKKQTKNKQTNKKQKQNKNKNKNTQKNKQTNKQTKQTTRSQGYKTEKIKENVFVNLQLHEHINQSPECLLLPVVVGRNQ